MPCDWYSGFILFFYTTQFKSLFNGQIEINALGVSFKAMREKYTNTYEYKDVQFRSLYLDCGKWSLGQLTNLDSFPNKDRYYVRVS